MKKINDSKVYLSLAISMLAAALVFGAVSYYSILSVEPKIEKLLAAKTDVDKSYKKAYLMLRDPQVFGGYGNFDTEGLSVKNTLLVFDKRIYEGHEIEAAGKAYFDLLLDRRKKGSVLGRNTMVFFLLLSIMFGALYIQERRA